MSTTFRTRRVIRFEDVDPVGVIYFPRQIALLMTALEELFRDALHLPWGEMIERDRVGLPTVEWSTTFRAPLRLGHEVEALAALESVVREHRVVPVAVLVTREAVLELAHGVDALVEVVGLAVREVEQQLGDGRAADARLLVAAVGALPGISAPISKAAHLEWLWVPSLLIYLYLAWAAMRGFRLRTYTSYPEPEGLRAHLTEEPTFTKRRLFAAMAAACATNKLELDQKACWVQRSQDGLILLGVWLVIVHVVRALS